MIQTPEDDRTLPIPQHLRDSLRAAQRDHFVSMDALRVAVCNYVDELRRSGVAYDGIVRAVKNLMEQAARSAAGSADAAKENRHLVETMIGWCDDHWKLPA